MPTIGQFLRPSSFLLILFAFFIPKLLSVETGAKTPLETPKDEEIWLKEEQNWTKSPLGDERENIQMKISQMDEEAKLNRVEDGQIQIFNELLALPDAKDRYQTMLGYCNNRGNIYSDKPILVGENDAIYAILEIN